MSNGELELGEKKKYTEERQKWSKRKEEKWSKKRENVSRIQTASPSEEKSEATEIRPENRRKIKIIWKKVE